MSGIWWLIAGIMLVQAICLFWRPQWLATRKTKLLRAKRRFHTQRERLEAKFIKLASAHSQADADRWTDCSFADEVAYVRNRATGELSAFVAMTIVSDNLERSFPDATDAVGNLQAGTAVFRFDRDHWETDGRAILNLSPIEAVAHYGDDLEIIGEIPDSR